MIKQNTVQLMVVVDQLRYLYEQLSSFKLTDLSLVQGVIGAASSVWLDLRAYLAPLNVMVEIVDMTDETIKAADTAVAALRNWFYNESGQNIDVTLFDPISDQMIPATEVISDQISIIQQSLNTSIDQYSDQPIIQFR